MKSELTARSKLDAAGMTGVWRIEWDDSIDGKMNANPKSCDVKLEFEGRKISGAFEGKVLGKDRDAKFEGTILGTEKPLIRFVQREGDYSCSYQISWVPKEGSVPTGVWHDTNGSSGEFTFLKYQ